MNGVMKDVMYDLGMTLVKKEVLKLEVLEQALKMKQEDKSDTRRSLADILVNEFKVDADAVYREVSKLYGFKELRLAKAGASEKRVNFIKGILERVPPPVRQIMLEQKILIFKFDENIQHKCHFISPDPSSKSIGKVARSIGARRYAIWYLPAGQFDRLLEQVYPAKNQFLDNLDDANIEIHDHFADEATVEEEAVEAEINKSVLVNLMEGMLLEGVRRGASDIHVIPRAYRTTEILFREDGKLYTWYVQEGVPPEAMVAVIKDRSKNVDRFERESAQDGFMQRRYDKQMIRFRVSILPIVASDIRHKLESVVIRILDDRNVITNLETLGFQPQAKAFFKQAITKPQGMIILTGPTGSGKSTTLLAALSHVNRPDNNTLTVEDPVEYLIPGVRQIKIGPKNNFDQALRSILRHDPDIVMVGEIRDRLTAEIAIKLANTGHLTFSTLHTNDAPSALSRLYKMEIETFLLAYAINAVIAQRLIRRLCDNCKRPNASMDHKIARLMGFTDEEIAQTTFYQAVGCEHCNHGYKGRIAIHEVLYFSKEVRSLIFSMGRDIDEEKLRTLAIKQGMHTLRQSGNERVKAGISTIEEVMGATTDE